MEVVSTMKAVY